ncbi:MAG: PQQ-binding-like beta-propeller repeat protein [Pirellulaceae bacterium]|nr:PQQ-binding-like beta-propeller repeat protein [Pirellulaceae bacterium]
MMENSPRNRRLMMYRQGCLGLLFLIVLPIQLAAEDWPQWRGPNRDGVWKNDKVLESFPTEQIPHKWSVSVAPGYSGPTVAKGLVYLTDRPETEEQLERVLCFDAATGKSVWKLTYPCEYQNIGYQAGPRASVTVDAGQAFALGAMGHLHVLDAVTGDVQWKSDLLDRFKIKIPIWGIAAAPIVTQDLVILMIGGRPDACIVALNRHTGEEVWRALSDRTSYAAPILIEQAGKRVLVCWTGDNIVGLNPADGQVYWKSEMPPKNMVIAIATPIVHKGRLFVTSFYDGAKMLQLDEKTTSVEEGWRARGPSELDTDALHSIMSTPIMIGDYVYGVDSYGELRCLEAETGKRIWEDQTATPRNRWSNIHLVRNGDRVWMFNERGELLIAKLSPTGFEEISRAKLIEPTEAQLKRRGKGVCWSHPAFADGHVFIRSDTQLVCASLLKGE